MKKPAAKKKAGRSFWGWTKRILIGLFLFHLFYIILLRWVDPPITLTQLGSLFGGHGLKRDYVDRSEIARPMQLAVMAAEDSKFPDHSGFDWKSIQKAMKYNEKKPGRSVRGGSTISQQTAKNVFLWQGRDWIRKGLEMYFTKMIEWIWGKERILEVYLNVVEMGPGIFGAEAAAQAYFKKPASALTRRQAAMIAACLPSPKRYTVKPLSPHVAAHVPRITRGIAFLEKDPEVKKLLGN